MGLQLLFWSARFPWCLWGSLLMLPEGLADCTLCQGEPLCWCPSAAFDWGREHMKLLGPGYLLDRSADTQDLWGKGVSQTQQGRSVLLLAVCF